MAADLRTCQTLASDLGTELSMIDRVMRVSRLQHRRALYYQRLREAH